MVFTDGITVGAKLDRNGLRPLRYTLTSDGLLVVGSEVGIADLHGKEVAERQRLGPGEMLLCDPPRGEFTRAAKSAIGGNSTKSRTAAIAVHIVSNRAASAASHA